jgi:hypothetical protein
VPVPSQSKVLVDAGILDFEGIAAAGRAGQALPFSTGRGAVTPACGMRAKFVFAPCRRQINAPFTEAGQRDRTSGPALSRGRGKL